MISSFSFLYLRSCEGDSVSLCSWLAISCSCRRRSFLCSLAILSKVSTTFGFSSASMAASDIWFSNSSSSMSESADDSEVLSPSAAAAGIAGAARNGVGGGERLAVGAERGCEQRRVHVVLGVGTGVGRFQIDDVAKEDLAFVEFVAPDDDGLERQRAFAQPCDHRLAAGLDAFGDRDFALARQQLDGAHLAQIHADRIVGALAGLGFLDLGDGLLRDLDQVVVGLVLGLFLGFLVAVGVLGLGDIDAHIREHRHDVLDLLRRGGVGRQDFVELIEDIMSMLSDMGINVSE